MAHEVVVNAAGGAAAFGNGPDDQGLAALHIARGKDARHAGHPVLIPPDVAAVGEPHAELAQQSVALRTYEPHRQQDQVDLYLELGPGTGLKLIRPFSVVISTRWACSFLTFPSSPEKRVVETENSRMPPSA